MKVSESQRAIIEQCSYLNTITYEELFATECHYLGIAKYKENGYYYEVTLTRNAPNIFLLIDNEGDFEVRAESKWWPTEIIRGQNKDLIKYLSTISK
jgi:hypothetical protein